MLKERIWNIFYSNENKRINKIDDIVVTVLIVLSIIVLVLETGSTNEEFTKIYKSLDTIITLVFTFEYILKIYANSYKKHTIKYIFSFEGFIDLVSILPFYIVIIVPWIDMRILRILRFGRLIRVLKLITLSKGTEKLSNVIKRKKSELYVSVAFMLLIIFMSSIIMYVAEHEAQPNEFKSVLDGVWWAVAALTTVGYGDLTPITIVGRFMAMVIAIFGIGIIAIPTGILSSGFLEYNNGNLKGEQLSAKYADLDKVCELYKQNLLTEEEFLREKNRILEI